ncbi:NAD(P)/FAD-dependent oxidoreductase [Lacicoccus alkaliphilus]|uniref:Ferredoxin--NADP reductase n=1 Tax=Lacicoccus alkaliphilus DSM 16010 TaxID=1123231 RepID=A0A1M7CSC5_9BACL|nr:NAD(P)/FAD-dependent oxidoreductase [Salinicoccus alkaliphilus]SHL70142.1 thioredoxin reductase (NADPH) [Salinicoccus alkaliphilus DSM 16010]
MKIYDTLIIGGGPAGLYAAFYAGLRGMSVKLIEHHAALGGKLNIYREKFIWDIGAVPAATGGEIVSRMIEQAHTFHPDVSTGVTCLDVEKEGATFKTATTAGDFHSSSVIIATGLGIYSPVKLNIEGADKYEMTNLHYTVKDLKSFKGKHILISGGGNTAVDWAHDLSAVALSVTLVCRKNELKGHEAMVEKLAEKNVTVIKGTAIEAFIPHSVKEEIHYVRLSDGTVLEADAVVINHGFDADCEFIRRLSEDMRMNEHQMIETQNTVETGIPGLYACGDQITYDNRVHLIASCFPEAAMAANFAKQFISGGEAAEAAVVSSHNEAFAIKNKKMIQHI